jgi:hypothetical protein
MKHFCCFSEAIREGAKLRPQGFGELHANGASCAIGAGREAIYGTTEGEQEHYDQIRALFPYLQTRASCPACPLRLSLFIVAYHLNDDHRWTREQIADWLQSEEDKLGFVTISETEESEALRNLTQELSDLGEVLKVTV